MSLHAYIRYYTSCQNRSAPIFNELFLQSVMNNKIHYKLQKGDKYTEEIVSFQPYSRLPVQGTNFIFHHSIFALTNRFHKVIKQLFSSN